MMATHRRLRVGTIDVDFLRLSDVAGSIASGTLSGGVHLCNAYTVALAGERADLAEALSTDAANLPDGMPVVWWARRHHMTAERVYGPDLMERVLDVGRDYETRHYLYGSTEQVLESLCAAIERRWPGAEVVGAESPTFGALTDEELRSSVERAETAGADVMWVGMGTPKQDLLVHRMSGISDLTFVAVGAAFDFIAGTKRQAPRWMMNLGMEWAFRLLTEPRRLWRRYVVYNMRFLWILFKERPSGSSHHVV